jgi:type VI secretion system secreted protein Hcp
MAVDVFLKIDGIPGESQDGKHKGEIDVMSWSWGATQTGTQSWGGGGGAGKVNVQDFHFTMKVNKASPKLQQAICTGQHIKGAILTCRKFGGKQEPYYIFKFTDLLISSYQTGGSSEEPVESISFNFAKYEVEYKQQNEKGSVGDAVKAGYDIKKNEKV